MYLQKDAKKALIRFKATLNKLRITNQTFFSLFLSTNEGTDHCFFIYRDVSSDILAERHDPDTLFDGNVTLLKLCIFYRRSTFRYEMVSL